MKSKPGEASALRKMISPTFQAQEKNNKAGKHVCLLAIALAGGRYVSRLPCELGFLMLVTSCSFFRLVEDQKQADHANSPAFPCKAHFAHLHALNRSLHRLVIILASLFLQ